jgi:hypothetical protein
MGCMILKKKIKRIKIYIILEIKIQFYYIRKNNNI